MSCLTGNKINIQVIVIKFIVNNRNFYSLSLNLRSDLKVVQRWSINPFFFKSMLSFLFPFLNSIYWRTKKVASFLPASCFYRDRVLVALHLWPSNETVRNFFLLSWPELPGARDNHSSGLGEKSALITALSSFTPINCLILQGTESILWTTSFGGWSHREFLPVRPSEVQNLISAAQTRNCADG